jgi:hypothetical protein
MHRPDLRRKLLVGAIPPDIPIPEQYFMNKLFKEPFIVTLNDRDQVTPRTPVPLSDARLQANRNSFRFVSVLHIRIADGPASIPRRTCSDPHVSVQEMREFRQWSSTRRASCDKLLSASRTGL